MPKKDLNEFLKLFYEILNNFKINIKIFKLFKQKLLFDMDYDYMNNIDDYLNYYMDCKFYNYKLIKNIPKFVKTINYQDAIKILKYFKKQKYFIFLYNKNYKKQKD